MTNVTRHALRVYAALSGLTEDKGDILDKLIPFLEPLLESANGKVYDPDVMSAALNRLYGWRMNRDVAEVFAERLLAKRYLRRVMPGTLVVTYEPPQDGGDGGVEIAEILDRIVDEFEVFPPKVTDLFQFNLTREQMKEVLIRFLVSLDAYTEEAFAERVERLKLDMQKQTLLDELAEGGNPLSPEDRYLCARFIRQLAKDKPEFVPHMARLASIGLLTDVVEDFVKPTTPEARSNLTVILDAPVALNLLGLSGNAAKDDIRNVVETLRGIGCSFLVLPVSCEEMSRNLSSMLRLPAPERHGPTHDAMRKGEVQEAYVRSVVNDPEQALMTVGVTVRPVDLTTYPASTRFFSEELYEGFFGGIRWKQDSVDARQHDAVCAAITMRLRAGQRSSDVLRSRVVFVSTNPRFARYARDFCVSSRLVGPNQVPPVVLQRELATTAWLRTGLAGQAGERITRDIPRSHLIASCERVLKTRREVVQAVHRTLKEFAPDRLAQYELMLSDQRSVQRLMDETLGEERLVNADNAERLLEEMRRATALEVEVEYRLKMRDQKKTLTAKAQAEREQAEVARLEQQAALDAAAAAQREAAAAMLREKEKEIAGLDERLAAAEREKAGLQARIEEADRRERERAGEIMGEVNRASRRVELISLAILWGGVATGFFATTLGTEGSANRALWWIGLPLALMAAYHFVQEVRQKPKVGLQTVLDALARRSLKRRLRQAGIDEERILKAVTIENGKVAWKG